VDAKLKRSVGALLAHIIKIDGRDVKKEAPLFCRLMGEDFECDRDEARALLERLLEEDYDLETEVEHIAEALKDDKLSKYHLLEQLNHIIYSDTISPEDYELFERIKRRLFPDR
jgi:uncharacterized tellurite resistance protein B-like protein